MVRVSRYRKKVVARVRFGDEVVEVVGVAEVVEVVDVGEVELVRQRGWRVPGIGRS